MTGHPQATALYGAPRIIWQAISDRAIQSRCKLYIVAKIGTPPRPVFYEASRVGQGLIASNTFAQRAKRACELDQAARELAMGQAA